jgi:putative mRNA 3-end processing factor
VLELRKQGLYCEAGDFYIDPTGAVDRAVVTHAHSDHARRGAKHYYSSKSGLGLVRARLGQNISIEGHAYGEEFRIGRVKLSFHPAGHILGSAQVRLECEGEVWVASGDYKREPDPTCEAFESVKCDVFITEATFGTPSYRWEKGKDLGAEILDWWEKNRAEGIASVVCAYSLGKTQRILGELHGRAPKKIFIDPNAVALTDCYRAQGVKLAEASCVSTASSLAGELIVAPSSFLRSPLAEKLGEYRSAFASGWMATGGGYGHSSAYDHGFTMSDHADWDDLVRTVRESGARRVYVQHRGHGALVRYLKAEGFEAFPDSALAPNEKKKDKNKPAQLALF